MAAPNAAMAAIKNVFRIDGWKNFLTGVNATTRDKRTASFIAHPQTFMQEDLERFFRGNDLARRICTLPALDMTRKGYELDIEDAEPEVKNGVAQYLKDLGWFKELFALATFARLYGRCYILVGVDDGKDMAEPVDFENIRSIKYLNVLDPWALRVKDLQRNPLEPDFGQPETFYVNITPAGGFQNGAGEVRETAQFGTVVHKDRVMWLDGSMMTPYQARFSGSQLGSSSNLAWCPDSIFVALYPIIRDYDQSWDSSAILLQDFAQAVYKIKGLGEMMASDGEKAVRDRMQIVDESRSVLRAMLLDAEFEDFERKATPITGLPEMMDRWLQRVSAAAEIPIPLLFGSPTGGLNASDDGAYEGYYNLVQAKQANDLEPVIRKMTRLAMCAKDNPGTNGTEPETWSICFEPLWSLSAKEEAELRKTQADTDALYITNQVLTPAEVATSRFGGEKYSTDTTIDADAHAAHGELIGQVQEAEAAALVAQHEATAENPNGPPADPNAPAPEAPEPGKNTAELEPHERAKIGAKPGTPAAAPAQRPGTPSLLGAVAPGGAGARPGASPSAGGEVDVQKTALNGAQVASLVAIITAVSAKEIPRDAGVQAIALSFQVSPEQADRILGTAGAGFEPKPPEPTPSPFGGPPGAPGAKPKPGTPTPKPGEKPAPGAAAPKAKAGPPFGKGAANKDEDDEAEGE